MRLELAERIERTVSTTVGTTASLKAANRTAIGHVLLQKAPLTKQEIAKMTSLSFSAVSNLVLEMQEEGLIREVGLAESGGGRRAVLYALDPSAYLVAGIDIQVERLVIALLWADGSVLCTHQEPLNISDGPTSVVQQAARTIERLRAEHQVTDTAVTSVGVSVPDPIDADQGMVLSPPNMPGWRNVPLRDMMESAFGVGCVIEKDANAAAFGECKYGSGRSIQHLLYVMADTGIGGAFIVNGDIYSGAFNDAGDIGHIPIDIRGPRCNCGAVGCVEALASGIAIEREIRAKKGYGMRLDDLPQLCQDDAEIEQIVRQAAEYLGFVVGGLTNAFNVSTVILGGSLLETNDVYFSTTVDVMKQQILPEFAHRVRIERPQLGGFSGAIGAAKLVFHLTALR
ncbi:MAG: ROK family transcriptional regulator [Alicyclobacillus sp.]|nr:ROK family transcriptional regulator [Alicyclobacillus sp.]